MIDYNELSKVISHALRHEPDRYNVELSKGGWVVLVDLVKGIRNNITDFAHITENDIIDLVAKADKRRHEIFDGRIRALHGHSLTIGNELKSIKPPIILYHSTSIGKVEKIKKEGLKPMERQFVHLATTQQAANEVALKKYQGVVLLQINALEAFENNISFYSNNENAIWLCEYVPADYLSVSESKVMS